MEWHLSRPDDRAVLDVRHAVSMHLRGRVRAGQDISVAELAFDELVRNARHHAGGPLHVEVVHVGRRPSLAVRDEGPGFTVEQACGARPGGGLHVLAQAVGPVRVEPAAPRGARVCVELPLELRTEREATCPFGGSHVLPAPRQADPAECGTVPSVAVAAGDDEVRAELVRVVASAGFAVVAAGEGDAAVVDASSPPLRSVRRVDDLTDRQREVLALLAEGLSNSAIANELVITKRAVEKHVTLILERLGLHDDDHHDRRVVAALLYVASESS